MRITWCSVTEASYAADVRAYSGGFRCECRQMAGFAAGHLAAPGRLTLNEPAMALSTDHARPSLVIKLK